MEQYAVVGAAIIAAFVDVLKIIESLWEVC